MSTATTHCRPTSRCHLRSRRGSLLGFACCLIVCCLVFSCNSPYPESESKANTYYSIFTEEPAHLDTAQAYGSFLFDLLGQIVEPPLQYSYLKRPYSLEPSTVTEMPEAEVREMQWRGETIQAIAYVLHVKKGVVYQDHPCFVEANRNLTPADVEDILHVRDFERTATRELVAADYVHAIRRLADPRLSCPVLPTFEQNILGMKEYGDALAAAIKAERSRREAAAGPLYNRQQDERYNPISLDYGAYDSPGVREIDKYTFEVILKKRYPQILYWMAMPFFAPVPPEALEFFNQRVLIERSIIFDRNPVGTGPYVLAEFDPSNQIVLERNPDFREQRYPHPPPEPPAGTKARQVYEGMKSVGMFDDAGKRLPMIDRAVFRMEKEWIPRWNKFLQGYYDKSGMVGDVFDQAVSLSSRGEPTLSEEMEQRGIRMMTTPAPLVYHFIFNIKDPVVGGYSEKQRKLRRAISIAFNLEEFISIFYNGQARAAHSPVPPGIAGYQGGKEGFNRYVYRWDEERGRPVRRSLEEAKKLLAEAGYPGGYGPDGEQLVIRFDNSRTGSSERPRLRFVTKQFKKLNIRLEIKTLSFNRLMDKLLAGNYQMLFWGWSADYPDAENFMFLLYGENARASGNSENSSNYMSPEFDRLFEKMETMEDSPERLEIIRQMSRVFQKDAPWFAFYHPVAYELVHEWFHNLYPSAVLLNDLKYLRIDAAMRAERRREWNQPELLPVGIVFVALLAAAIPAVVAGIRHIRSK